MSEPIGPNADKTGYVTTTDQCSMCGAKLKNAETSRNDYQAEAFRLSKDLTEAMWLLQNIHWQRREENREWFERWEKFVGKAKENNR